MIKPHHHSRWLLNTIILGLSLLLLPAGLFAQAVTSLNGTVTDGTGALVPSAAIELVNSESGVKRETKSDAAGAYVFPQLAPGTYNLTARAEASASPLSVASACW